MRTAIRCSAVVCAVLLGACGKDSTGPNDSQTPLLNQDLAQAAADATGDDVDMMREPVLFTTFAPALAPGDGQFAPTNCPYNATTKRLECPTITRDNGNFTITRSYAFWADNAKTQSQDHFDALLTAVANVQAHLSGARTLPNWEGTVDRLRDMTASGLLGTETQRTWNGTGSETVTRSKHTDNGPERSYNLACSVTVTDVVVPVEHNDERFPLSGTITRTCDITFVGGPRDGQTINRTVTVTFDGTQSARMLVGGRLFDMNLHTRGRSMHP